MRSRGTRCHVVAMAGLLLAGSPCAFALNPALGVSQYAHTPWKIRDGFPRGAVTSIAQTPDGYLWLGSEFGLFRFDGVRSVPWQPPVNQHLPSSQIMSLLAARDGTLWIGTGKGLASWKEGKFKQYPELGDRYIFKILQDREGSIWASGVGTTGKLCAIRNGSVQCYGDDGALGIGALNLYEDSKGNLWAGVHHGLWRWRPGSPKFYPLDGEPDGIQGLGEDDDGTLLVGWNGGLWRFVDGKTEAYPLPRTIGQFRARRLLRDRDGGLWIGTSDRGLVRAHHGKRDVFAPSDGLSGEKVITIFEDREGSIWVSTANGLDRFHDLAVTTLTVNQGLRNAVVLSVVAARDGSVWFATRAGLSRWMRGQITNYGRPHTEFLTGKGERIRTLNELDTIAVFQDDRERIWVATTNGFGYLKDDRFIPVDDLPGGPVTAIAQDTAGNVWVGNEPTGLFQVLQDRVVQQIPWSRLGRSAHATAMAAAPSGGLWMGFHLGGVAYFNDGQVRASYSATAGLGEGRVNYLGFDRAGALWAATEGGLSRLKDGRIATLTTRSGLPCDTIHWAVEDDLDSFWLYTACGLVRIARSELDRWIGDAKQAIQVTVFDASDGVRSLGIAGHFAGQVAKSADGKLWFLPWDGVSVVDPRHLPFNNLPPPVHIEQITANRKRYDATAGMRLPALIRDLQIDYTALSLAAPEKVRFRYRLEGHDTDWQEADTRRQAFYNDLPPRKYRFRAIACNNSGVWNDAGASFDFFIEPAYYQTTWFLVSCAAVFLAILAGLYRLRLWYLVSQFNMRLEERVGERTRIARDLHDTLLQSFQGVLLKFHAVTYALPDRPAEARKTLESAIEEARQAIAEGRDAVQGLRSPTVPTEDLARAVGTLGEGLTASPDGRPSPDFRVQVEGTTRKLAPVVRDEVYRIAGEAMRNAFRHAGAGRIEVDIHYDNRQLMVRIRDNGKGIDAKVLDEGGSAGHHGLPGMHERVKLVGGKLAIWSELHSGTEIELTVPASVAYAKVPAASRPPSSGKETG